MEKSHLTRMVVGGALCVLLTCSMTPAIALAGGGSIAAGSISGDTSLGQEVGEANRGVFEPQAKKPALSLTRAPSGSITLKLGSTYAIGAKASKGAKISYFAVTPGRVSVSKTGVLKARATGTAYVLVNAKKSGKVNKKVRVRVVSAKKYKTVKSISSKANKKAPMLIFYCQTPDVG